MYDTYDANDHDANDERKHAINVMERERVLWERYERVTMERARTHKPFTFTYPFDKKRRGNAVYKRMVNERARR